MMTQLINSYVIFPFTNIEYFVSSIIAHPIILSLVIAFDKKNNCPLPSVVRCSHDSMFHVPCQVAMVGQNNEHQNQVNIKLDSSLTLRIMPVSLM